MSPTLDAEPYRDSIHISARPELVFDYFTKPEALVRWIGERAVLDPRPSGEFTVFFESASVPGRYLEVDPPRRVVVTWGRGGSVEFPPGASTLEVTLIPEAGGTTVRIVHSGLPPGEAARHAAGWTGFLPRLASAAGETGESDTAEPAADADSSFASVAAAFASDPEVTSGGRGFGSSGLKVNGKLFALVSSRSELVFKLPKQRVLELVTAGAGQPFDAGKGRPMKEWIAIERGASEDLVSLAREAHRYVRDIRA
jgi:uncharacterized protein YndB with AHSA1/START domain